jgi:tRNA uracil 4-sulfurtransferase
MRAAFHNRSSVAPLLLVRYGELTLKSPPVRREFERALRHNILEQFAASSLSCRLRNDQGHMYVEVDDAVAAQRVLGRVFGITSMSEVVESTSDRGEITATALRLVDPLLGPGATFAVRGRRTGQHNFTSQQLAADLGGDILERFGDRGIHVDLEHPNVELAVEVRDRKAYLSTGRSPGPGGLPLGVAGRVAAIVDGPRAGVGAYLMMKRGCRCAILPVGEGGPAIERVLRRFDPKAFVAPPAPDMDEGQERLASLAEENQAEAVVLPLDVDRYPAARDRWGERVVFSPTVGLSDEEVEVWWHAIATRAA